MSNDICLAVLIRKSLYRLVFTQPLIGNYGVPSSARDENGLLKYFESPVCGFYDFFSDYTPTNLQT